jgi:DNA-binding CsgD family transcriptional regulator
MANRNPSPARGKGVSELDDHLDDIVQWKLTGATDQAIANQLGVHRSTVTRFCNRAMVRKQIDQAQHELIVGAVRRASASAGAAIGVLMHAVDMSNDVPMALRIKAASEIVKLVGVERLAQSMDMNTEALADHDAAFDAVRAKAALMEQRVVEADAIELPTGLRVVE